MCLTRNGGHLLMDVLENDPCEAPVKRMFAKIKTSILDKTRNGRTTYDAVTGGSTGDSFKQRKCRIGLVDDSPEERERNIEIYMRLLYVNGIRPVMEAIDKIDPEFVDWGMERLADAKDVSTSFDRDDIKGIDHLFGGTREQVSDGDMGCTAEQCKKRQTQQAEKDLCDACKVHDIEGHGIVRWCMVLALVGREMLSRHNGGEVSRMFGPLQTNGKQMSPVDVFGKVFEELDRSFFGVGNMSINAMRTTQDTVAVEHGLEM
ncbi:unnamed protein product, partial [Ectocarpus sp. 13 AM-2016]